MLRSMFTAVSALNVHQTYLDVIADNLANSNTPGFKANRVIFQDQIAQLLSPGAGPSATMGGKNATQVGMGTQIGSTLTLFTQGTLQGTGRNQDISIQGDGFLIYKKQDGNVYSREGALTLDASGFLVNSSTGMRVQGWMASTDPTQPINTNSPVGDIQALLDRTTARATTANTITGNLNPSDTTASVTYNVYDSLGAAQKVQVDFTKVDANHWSWAISSPTGIATTGTIAFDASGQAKPVDATDPIPTSAPTGSITIPAANGANAITLSLDFSNITKLTTAGASDIAMTYQDGVQAGQVSDISIENTTGKIYLQFSNGLREVLGQLALARFNNSTGLVRQGNTTFAASENSGTANIGAAATGGRGTIAAGYLEASNVDMANEFTNMILAQRGFQAQTRVITTSDEILQELVNLKR
jgi:flagellar hook protein FlgE